MTQRVAHYLPARVVCSETGLLDECIPTVMDALHGLTHELDDGMIGDTQPLPAAHMGQKAGRQRYSRLALAGSLLVVRLPLKA